MPETPKSKKILISTILISIIFPVFILGQADFSLPNPGLTPDSHFYFFDTLWEKVSLFFTFAPEKKAEKAIQFAEEKLAEAKAMAEKNKPEAIEKANQKYQEFLGLANQKTHEAKEKGRDVEELAILITEKTLKHQEILVEVFEKVPEQAKIAVEKAIEVSRKGSEVAVQAVTGAKKDELLQKIEEIRVEREEKEAEFIKPEVTCQDECSPTGLKKCSNNGYQTCGNYDTDDCLEWSSITNCPANTICQNGICVQQKCTDGTLYSQCSTNKPKYCEGGNLIDNCNTCGCPVNQLCQNDGSCCRNECSQLGSKACLDDNSYQVCISGENGCFKWASTTSCIEKSCRMGNCVAVSFPRSEARYWAIILGTTIGENITLPLNRNTNFKNILLKNGWQEDYIKTLAGKDATYENFMSALDWLENNSSSNDIILLILNAHGGEGVMLLEDNKLLKYSELGEKLNNLKYKGILIIIESCFGYSAIPYLEKENRVIIWPTSVPSLIWQTLSGIGDFRGNNDDWVSAEEIYNMNQLYDIAFPGENKTLLQDNFPGELNIVFLNGYWRDLDQYNPQNTTVYGSYGTGVGAIKENVDTYVAQSFTPNLPILTKVALTIVKKGNPGPLTLSIRENLSGPDLTSVTLSDSLFLTDINQLTDFDFQDIEVVPGKTYYIVIKASQVALKAEGDFNYYAIEESYSLKESDDYYSKGELSIFNEPFPPHGFFHTDLAFFTFGKLK